VAGAAELLPFDRLNLAPKGPAQQPKDPGMTLPQGRLSHFPNGTDRARHAVVDERKCRRRGGRNVEVLQAIEGLPGHVVVEVAQVGSAPEGSLAWCLSTEEVGDHDVTAGPQHRGGVLDRNCEFDVLKALTEQHSIVALGGLQLFEWTLKEIGAVA